MTLFRSVTLGEKYCFTWNNETNKIFIDANYGASFVSVFSLSQSFAMSSASASASASASSSSTSVNISQSSFTSEITTSPRMSTILANIHNYNCHYTAALYSNEAFIVSHNEMKICSRFNEIFILIIQYLHCSLTFIRSEANFGGRLVNESWTGILAHIERKEADFIPAAFSAVNQREKLLHFDFTLPTKHLLTILSYPKYRSNPWALFLSFSPVLWTLQFVAFVVFVALFITFQLDRSSTRHGVCGDNRRRDIPTLPPSTTRHVPLSSIINLLLVNIFDLFALFIGQGNVPIEQKILRVRNGPKIGSERMRKDNNSHRNASIRIAIACALFATFLLRQSFNGNFTSIILSRGRFRIDRFDQLLGDRRQFTPRKFILEKNSTILQFFRQLFPHVTAQKVELIGNREMLSAGTLWQLIHDDKVMILSRHVAEAIMNSYPSIEFHVSRQGIIRTISGPAIRRTLAPKLKIRLSRFYKRLNDFGINNRIEKLMPINVYSAFQDPRSLSLPLSSSKASSKEAAIASMLGPGAAGERDNLHLQNSNRQNILAFFYLYFIGLTLAAVIFFIELFLFYISITFFCP